MLHIKISIFQEGIRMSDTIKKHVKDPGSAITHFIGMLMAVFAAVPLIIKATHEPSPIYVVSIAI